MQQIRQYLYGTASDRIQSKLIQLGEDYGHIIRVTVFQLFRPLQWYNGSLLFSECPRWRWSHNFTDSWASALLGKTHLHVVALDCYLIGCYLVFFVAFMWNMHV